MLGFSQIALQSSYSVENLLALASVKKNSTAHNISGIFQNFKNMQSKAGGSNLNTCNTLKGTPLQSLSWTFSKIFKTPLKSLQFQKSFYSGFFNSIVGCRMKYYSFTKMELYYIHFSAYFPKFSVQQFQSTLIKPYLIQFRRVWVVHYSSVLIETWLQQRPFLQNFGD